MIVTVEVIRAIRLPAGAMLDGAVLESDQWVKDGRHTIDADLINEKGWAAKGYVSPESVDGKPFIWHSCC